MGNPELGVTVFYTDGTEAECENLAAAVREAEETILGCDFSVGVDRITGKDGTEYSATWSLALAEVG